MLASGLPFSSKLRWQLFSGKQGCVLCLECSVLHLASRLQVFVVLQRASKLFGVEGLSRGAGFQQRILLHGQRPMIFLQGSAAMREVV